MLRKRQVLTTLKVAANDLLPSGVRVPNLILRYNTSQRNARSAKFFVGCPLTTPNPTMTLKQIDYMQCSLSISNTTYNARIISGIVELRDREKI